MYIGQPEDHSFLWESLCSPMCLENKHFFFLVPNLPLVLYVENQKTNNWTIPKHHTCISLCADFQHQLIRSGTDSVQLVKDEIEPAI